MNHNKNSAVHFLNMIVEGEIDVAYEKYVDMEGKHHNAYFKEGFLALKDAMKESHEKFPKKQFEMKNIICENDLVAIHSHVILNPNSVPVDKGIAVVHIFKFKNNKIIEMWNIGQPLPKERINKDGAF